MCPGQGRVLPKVTAVRVYKARDAAPVATRSLVGPRHPSDEAAMKAIYVFPFLLASVLGGTTLLQPAHVGLGPHAWAYSNLNLPAPVPAGEAPSPDVLVQRTAVQGLGRPVIKYTPQITEVRPELKITERTYNVPVPKPVYETKQVTPVHTKFVPEPYAVQQPFAVPQPYAVPTPVNVQVPVPQPVHVQHNVVAQPAVVAYNAPAAAVHALPAQVAALPAATAVQTGAHIISPVTYNAATAVHGIAATPLLTQTITHKVELDDDDDDK
ncbi:uncharacterized protein [Macrobrachium rosenbergii]|uniref:uncharacterized protein n=1 Tax=Macrobrachium rosenbergii TaxID=79674 RepID=UPI0034D532CD